MWNNSQTQTSFSLGQAVYVRDDKAGWLPGVVGSNSNDGSGHLTVFLTDGESIACKSGSVLLRPDDSELCKCQRLTEVNPVNEATVLECLHQRFSHDKFYTLAGSTIVAVNPFKSVEQLYSLSNIWGYHNNANSQQDLEPHVYMIASKAYSCMVRQLGQVDQSIVVSGESGAGKTISAKHLLRYLTIVSSPDEDIDLNSSIAGSVIERRVLDSNPLLEAFGNAATPRNDNSSRFGKFIQLQFHRGGTIMGGVIQTYLLEKTRVVHQGLGENNFHIFYQLMSVQEEAQLPEWLEEVKTEVQTSRLECALSPNGCGNNSVLTTINAMSEIGISRTCQVAIFQTLLAILHLTTLKFLPDKDGDSTAYSDDLATVWSKDESARLLGVSGARLHYALLNRSIVSGAGGRPSRRSVYHKPVIMAEAESRRDCLAMLLYSRLFEWLVKFINHQIKVDKFDHTINLLDIYGFEAFDENNLEQLCINYANERLQQHYVVHFLRDLQAEYEAEGIHWTSVSYTDNKRCVEVLDGATGVFGVLNEDVYLNRRSVDDQLCSRVVDACADPTLVRKPHAGTYGHQFIVSHYAGDVLYTVADIVAKNKDTIPQELTSLLASSSNPFVLELFSDEEHQATESQSPSHNMKAKRSKSVLTKFKSSLDSLMQSLVSTDVHYIRCIKPNCVSRSGLFDRAFVLHQLRACGTVQTVDICQLGYPIRMKYKEFVHRYGVFVRAKHLLQDFLHSRKTKSQHCKSEGSKSSIEEELGVKVEARLLNNASATPIDNHEKESQTKQHRAVCVSILVSSLGSLQLDGVERQFGPTKLFLTQQQMEHLEEIRTHIIHLLVCRAQSWWKGCIQYRRYNRQVAASITIQTSWRAFTQFRRHAEVRRSAWVIQRCWRLYKRRVRFRRALEGLRRHRECEKFTVSQNHLSTSPTSYNNSSTLHRQHALSHHSQKQGISTITDDVSHLQNITNNLDLDTSFTEEEESGNVEHFSDDSGIMTRSEAPSGDTRGLTLNTLSPSEHDVAVLNCVDDQSSFNKSQHCHGGHTPPPVKKWRHEFSVDGVKGQENVNMSRSSVRKVTTTSAARQRGDGSVVARRKGRRREDLHIGDGVITCRKLTRAGYRFHVRASVLKHGHTAHHSYLPHGLPDVLPDDDATPAGRGHNLQH